MDDLVIPLLSGAVTTLFGAYSYFLTTRIKRLEDENEALEDGLVGPNSSELDLGNRLPRHAEEFPYRYLRQMAFRYQFSYLPNLTLVELRLASSPTVDFSADGFHMLGIDATANPAQMIQLKAGRNGAVLLLVVVAMSALDLPVACKMPVSKPIDRPLPDPARGIVTAILNGISRRTGLPVMPGRVAHRLSLNVAEPFVRLASRIGFLAASATAIAVGNVRVFLKPELPMFVAKFLKSSLIGRDVDFAHELALMPIDEANWLALDVTEPVVGLSGKRGLAAASALAVAIRNIGYITHAGCLLTGARTAGCVQHRGRY